MADDPHRASVGSLEALKRQGCLVAGVAGRTIAVFWHEGRVWAVDNRCPHMGFPLSRGTVHDGLLTCHWHHARFDLASGGTLDLFADDVPAFPATIEGDQVFVEVPASAGDEIPRGFGRLQHGLEDQNPLVLAKSALTLQTAGADVREMLRRAAHFGSQYRAAGWGPGLTILTAVANVLPVLGEDERPLALFHGALRVSQDCAGQPPRFPVAPLAIEQPSLDRLKTWFRRAVEGRDSDAAERVLRTAIESGMAAAAVADIVLAAATDHYFMDAGHTLDYVVKAFELLDHLGWQDAATILPALAIPLCRAGRSEEEGAWRHPQDLPALLEPAFAQLDRAEVGSTRPLSDHDFDALVTVMLGDVPSDTVSALLQHLRRGVRLTDLGLAVAHASVLRIVRFSRSNELGDWDTVHNTLSSCNALVQALERAPSRELARGLFHAAMKIYLDRFLNVPPAALPEDEPVVDAADAPAALLALLNSGQQVTAAARLVHAHLVKGGDEAALLRSLGLAVLREDAGFHDYQALDAAVRHYAALRTRRPAAARRPLVALARFEAARCPTRRALGQTYQIALRLHRGDELFTAQEA
jgi:nitrite reductase/ring-hydroxylating ferredoxin subunit